MKTTHSVVLDYAVDVHELDREDLQLSYGELGNFRWEGTMLPKVKKQNLLEGTFWSSF